MCDFDSSYDVKQIDSVCWGCNTYLPPKCTVLKEVSTFPVEFAVDWSKLQDPSLFTCPDGYTKLNPIPQDILPQIGSSKNNCNGDLDYNFIAANLCTFQQPPMPDSQQLLCCLNQATKQGNLPPCAKGYCAQNISPDSPCVKTMSEHCIKNGFDDNCKTFMNLTSNQTAREKILEGFFKNQLADKSLTNPYNQIVAEICTNSSYNLQTKCDELLTPYCTQFNNRTDIFNNQSYLNLCGCHLPSADYILDDQSCDPICNFPNTVTNNGKTCQKDICVFEGSVIESLIEGKIDLNSICGGSSNNNLCYFSESFLDLVDKYSSQLKISSNCQQCFSFDEKDKISGQNAKPIKCVGQNVPPTGLSTLQKVLIGIGISAGVLLLFGFIFFVL